MRFLILFVALLGGLVPAGGQNRKSDWETAGLKGSVKTVRTEIASDTIVDGRSTEGEKELRTLETFDSDGELRTVEHFHKGKLSYRSTYLALDGFRASKFEDFSPPPNGGGPGRPCPPDPRYDTKLRYEYDSHGNRGLEEGSDNCGFVDYTQVNKFDARDNLIESVETRNYFHTKPPQQVRKTVYNVDSKGNVLSITGETDTREFSQYELDSHGNWSKRSVHSTRHYDKTLHEGFSVEYRTFVYY